MNSKQVPQPSERAGPGKRISEWWRSRTRLATALLLVSTGVVINCCCLIIPLWDYSGGP